MLAGGFLNLGPAKNMSKPFFEENERITNVFKLRECKARSNSVSERGKIHFDPNIFMNYTAKIKKMHLIEKNYQHVKSLYY